MAEYIFRPENDSNTLADGIEDMCALMPKDWYGTIHGQIVRCRDCKWCMAYMAGTYCDYMAHAVELDGFCAWGSAKKVDR